jgi:hypothetical protein
LDPHLVVWSKQEGTFFMMMGLILVVLLSTQSVLSKISSSSNKLTIETEGYAHQLKQVHNSYSLDRSMTSHNETINTGSSLAKNSHSVLQEIGWMQAVVEYRVKLANVAFEMEQYRKNNAQEIKRQAEKGIYTMDISPLHDLISEMVGRID